MRPNFAVKASVLLWLLFLVVPARAAESFHSDALGVTFPGDLGGLPLVTVTDYEKQQAGLGIGLSYRGDAAKADIYVYNAGMPSVPAGVKSKVMVDHFYAVSNDVVEMERRGRYQNVQVLIPQEETLIGKVKFLHAQMRFTQDGIPRESHVFLTGMNGQFVKVRFTFPEAQKEAAEKIQRDFFEQLGRVLDGVASR
jgi:hypothetical protein